VQAQETTANAAVMSPGRKYGYSCQKSVSKSHGKRSAGFENEPPMRGLAALRSERGAKGARSEAQGWRSVELDLIQKAEEGPTNPIIAPRGHVSP
jgi:hypothetical protein